MDKKLLKISIIVLNWNGWRDTIECLESLYKITYPNYDVIVVDNGSEDDSIRKINEYCKGKIKVKSKFFEYDSSNKPIKIIEYTREETETEGEKEIEELPLNKRMILIKNEKNYGFAEGNNIGMRYALKVLNPDYILLLNNDIVVHKKFLEELVKVAEGDDKIGVVGPKVFYYNNPKILQSFGMKVNHLIGKIEHIGAGATDNHQFDEITEINAVNGCAMFLSKNVVSKVGGFDKTFFTYVEELDLCLRILKNGYKIAISPESKIYHKIRGSKRGKVTEELIFYRARNYSLMINKNFTKSFTLFSMTNYFILLGVEVVLQTVKYQNPRILLGFFKGIKDSLILIFLNN